MFGFVLSPLAVTDGSPFRDGWGPAVADAKCVVGPILTRSIHLAPDSSSRNTIQRYRLAIAHCYKA